MQSICTHMQANGKNMHRHSSPVGGRMQSTSNIGVEAASRKKSAADRVRHEWRIAGSRCESVQEVGIVYLQERKNTSRRTPSRRLIVRPHTPPKTTTTGKRSDFEALREKKCNRMERIKQAYRCKHRTHPPPSLPKFPMKPCSSQRMDRGEHSRHLPPIAHPSPPPPPPPNARSSPAHHSAWIVVSTVAISHPSPTHRPSVPRTANFGRGHPRRMSKIPWTTRSIEENGATTPCRASKGIPRRSSTPGGGAAELDMDMEHSGAALS